MLENKFLFPFEHAYKVKSDDIVVSFSSVEFDGKSTWVTCQIRKFATQGNGGKAHEHWSLDTLATEEVGLLVVSDECNALRIVRFTLVKSETSAVVSK
jgi:hypothetical protein